MLSGVTVIVKRLRLSLLVCAFAATTFTAALAQSTAIEIVDAQAAYDQMTGKPVVAFRMSPTSARVFAELTAKNVGRPASIIVDGHVMSTPIIRTPITGGAGQIVADFDIEQARSLAHRLSDGTSKMAIEIVSDGGSSK
jgi:preprotein translocase subunit SecD